MSKNDDIYDPFEEEEEEYSDDFEPIPTEISKEFPIADNIKKGTLSQFFDWDDYNSMRSVSKNLKDTVDNLPRKKLNKAWYEKQEKEIKKRNMRFLCRENQI